MATDPREIIATAWVHARFQGDAARETALSGESLKYFLSQADAVLAALKVNGIILAREQVWVRFDQLPGPESCTFIETEDSTGAGVGSNVGLEWTEDEMGALLGPFYVPVSED